MYFVVLLPILSTYFYSHRLAKEHWTLWFLRYIFRTLSSIESTILVLFVTIRRSPWKRSFHTWKVHLTLDWYSKWKNTFQSTSNPTQLKNIFFRLNGWCNKHKTSKFHFQSRASWKLTMLLDLAWEKIREHYQIWKFMIIFFSIYK